MVPLAFVDALESAELVDLLVFFVVVGAHQFQFAVGFLAFLGEVGVHADDGQGAVVFLVFVHHGFVLDLAALVHGVHRAEYAAAFVEAFEFLQYGFFHLVRELLDDVGTLPGVFAGVEAEFTVDDELDGDIQLIDTDRRGYA